MSSFQLKTGVLASVIGLFCCSSLTFAKEASFSEVYQAFQQAYEQQDYAAALAFSREALALGKAEFGEESENTINLHYNLANMLHLNGQPEDAFDELQTVIDLREEQPDQTNQLFIAQIEALIVAGEVKGWFASHIPSAVRAVLGQAQKLAEQLDQDSAEHQWTNSYQFLTTVVKGNLIVNRPWGKRLLSMAEDTREIMAKSLPNYDKRALEMDFLIANLHQSMERRKNAATYFERVVSVIDEQLDTSHPYELIARSRLVELYERMGESEKSTEHCVAIGEMVPWQEDMDAEPLYRQHPEYPIDYARNRKDGMARFAFTIDTYGFVTDIELLEVEGGKQFAEEAEKALAKWRYAPKFENGQAVIAANNTVQLDFKIQR